MADVVDALCDVAAQFNPDSDGTTDQKTPQRQTATICVATNDCDLTHAQWLQVLHLFCTDMAAADAYLAIEDAELQTNFILGTL